MAVERCEKCQRPFNKTRSLNQNAYMFGVVYKILSDHTGYSVEAIHELMKQKFLGRMFVLDGENYTVPSSTTDFDTKAMENYLQEIREWASEKLGCFIPLPNEVA